MKTNLISISVLILISISILTPLSRAQSTPAINVIQNGTFEASPWAAYWGTSSYTLAYQPGHESAHALWLYTGNDEAFQTLVINVDDIAEFSYWFKGVIGGGTSYYVKFYCSDGSSFREDVPQGIIDGEPAGLDWTFVNVTNDVRADGAGKTVNMIEFNGGSVYPYSVDDVVLSYHPVIAEPTPGDWSIYVKWAIYIIILAGLLVLGIIVYKSARANARGK